MKNVAVVLGNRINDDGSFTETMVNRLKLAIKLNQEMDVPYFVLSGGVANPVVKISEALRMRDYLIKEGFPENKIIIEPHSMTTKENAIFTCKLLEKIDFDHLIIVSTYEHFKTWNAIGYFNDAIEANPIIRNKNINLMIYTSPMEYDK